VQSVETITIVREIPADGAPFVPVAEHRTETRRYRFSELSEDAQQTAVEHAAEQNALGVDAEMLRDDDYWQEKAASMGLEIESRTWTNSYGYTGQTLEVYWDSYPWYAYASVRVDVADFLRVRKLGNRYRLLLSAIARGEADATVRVDRSDSRGYGDNRHASIDVNADGWRPAERVTIQKPAGERFYAGRFLDVRQTPMTETAYVTPPPTNRVESRYDRLCQQAADVESLIDDAVSDLLGFIATSLQDNDEWYGSEERAREELRDFDDANWFDANGQRLDD
jgi:hypothetical protein